MARISWVSQKNLHEKVRNWKSQGINPMFPKLVLQSNCVSHMNGAVESLIKSWRVPVRRSSIHRPTPKEKKPTILTVKCAIKTQELVLNQSALFVFFVLKILQQHLFFVTFQQILCFLKCQKNVTRYWLTVFTLFDGQIRTTVLTCFDYLSTDITAEMVFARVWLKIFYKRATEETD